VGALAQLTDADTLRFGYRFSASGTVATGNLERLLLVGVADMYTSGQVVAFRTSNTYQYGTFGAFRTENDLFSKNFLYLHREGRFYPYLMAWVETNVRRQFHYRYQAGPGVSYKAIQQTNHQMKLSLTATFEETWYKGDEFSDAAFDGSDYLQTYRATLRLFGRHALLEQSLYLRYELWGQQSLDDQENRRLHADVSLEYPLKKHLMLRASFNYNRETPVLSGVWHTDTFTVFGITYANIK
jgi:hypothetical protein